MPTLSLTSIEKSRIQARLSELNHPDAVIAAGLDGLIDDWRTTVQTKIPSGIFSRKTYLLALASRRLINELKLLIEQPSYQQLENELVPLDEKFYELTAETTHCLKCGKKKGTCEHDPSICWYYFRTLIHHDWSTKQ